MASTPPAGTRAASRTLIGRAHVIERLADALSAVVDEHEVSAMFIEGPAGIGKTRIVQEFASLARSQGADVLVGRCVAQGDQIMPYAPIVDLLSDLVRREGAAAVLVLAGPPAPELARLVPALGDGQDEPTRASSSRLFQAICAVLDGLSRRQPLVLVVEDLHWADGSTRDMMTLLAHQLRGDVFLLFTLRTDEAPRDPGITRFVAELGRGAGHRVVLDPLTRDEQARQISDILGVPPVTELLDEVYGRAEGNPFFAEELLALGSGSEVPGTVRDLLLARLESLSPATRQLLRAACVVGRRVPHRLLEAVTDRSGEALDAEIRAAVDNHVLVVDDADGGTFQFRHALLQEAIAGSILPGEAVRLHSRVAEALTDDPSLGGGTRFVAGRVANHWYASDDAHRALVAAVAAAREATAALACGEALFHYDRALELLETVPDGSGLLDEPHYRLLWRAAEVAHLAAHPGRAAQLIRAAIDAVDPAEPLHHGYLYERLGRYLWMAADGEGSLAAYERAMALTPADPPTSWRAAVVSGYSQILMLSSRYDEALELARTAIDIAQLVPGSRSIEGHARNNLGVSLAHLGRFDDGVDALLHARRIAEEEMEDVDDVARAIVNLHSIHLNAGRLREAADIAIEGIDVVERLGLQRRKGVWCRCDAAGALLLLGDHDDALRLLDEAWALRPAGIDRVVVDMTYGQVLLRTGDLIRARQHLEEARTGGQRLTDGQLVGPLYAALVEAAAAQGDFCGAADLAEEGSARLLDDEDASFCVPLHAAAVAAIAEQVVRGEGPPDAGEVIGRWLARSAAALGRGADVPVARLHLETASREAARADGSDDARAWNDLAARWDEVPKPYRAAYARLRAAEAHLTAGERAEALVSLREAWTGASAIGAGGLAKSIKDVARRARIKLPSSDDVPDEPRPYRMTPREREILLLVAEGLTDRVIGTRLFISHRTVGHHVSSLLAKLGATRRSELAALAHREGLVFFEG